MESKPQESVFDEFDEPWAREPAAVLRGMLYESAPAALASVLPNKTGPRSKAWPRECVVRGP